jgi:methyltransferase (TIGR00027 family)
MEEGKPSSTAIAAALARAAHLHFDGVPKVFADPFALRLAGLESEAALHTALQSLRAEFSRRAPEFGKVGAIDARARVLMRQRYAEDELGKALARGVSQYVILGAGLDSFAYRRSDLADSLQVFEVDHPASQQWKRARLAALNLAPPPNLTLLPIDFEHQTLEQGLRASGYSTETPAFFSWLGVLLYLTEQPIFENLIFVASGAPGTEIVFDYYVVDDLLDDQGRKMAASAKAAVAARGEPVGAQFYPDDISARVRQLGFSQVSDFGPDEANARYFSNRVDGLELRIPGVVHMLKARVFGDEHLHFPHSPRALPLKLAISTSAGLLLMIICARRLARDLSDPA